MERVYHIYAKQECLYNNLSESIHQDLGDLKGNVGLMKTDYVEGDLSYEVCEVNRTSALILHIDNG